MVARPCTTMDSRTIGIIYFIYYIIYYMEEIKEELIIKEIPFEDLPQKIYSTGQQYAIAKSNWEMLDESKKSVLASFASEITDGSEALRDRQARIHPEFREYLKTVQTARIQMIQLEYKLKALELQFECYRSNNSLKKLELKTLPS